VASILALFKNKDCRSILKLAPKKYGDKIEVSGDADNPLKIERIERVVVGEVIEQRSLTNKEDE
jgi:hypothetical protein